MDTASVIRSSWSLWPCTRAEANQLEVPLGLVYTPFALSQPVQVVNYDPVRSRQGNTILSPVCHVDFRAKVWNDPISGGRNAFPPLYASQISEQMLPAELTHPAMDYVLNGSTKTRPTVLLVVDTALYEEELEALKDSLQQAITLLPSDTRVGLITYSTSVNIHELGFSQCVKSYVFRGNAEVTQNDMMRQLRIHKNKTGGAVSEAERFICTLENVENTLTKILDDLNPSSWPTPQDNRPARCTGAALSAAVGLMELLAYQQPGRIMLFSGGVCTTGPGMVVGPSLADTIRQHQHIQKSTKEASLSGPACAFYRGLAYRAIQSGHAIDLLCCSLDQTGLYEMRICSERTGGLCVMSDTFSLNVFKDSLREVCRAAGPQSAQAYNVKVEVMCSKEVKVAGGIGCVTSTQRRSACVSESVVGEGNTCEWVCGVMDASSSLAIYLDVVNNNAASVKNKNGYVQFQVSYIHPNGERRIRVHTICYQFCDGGIIQLGSGFDQEVATCLMARLAVYRANKREDDNYSGGNAITSLFNTITGGSGNTANAVPASSSGSAAPVEDLIDIIRWLDRKLIRLCSVFGEYEKDKPDTFQLNVEFEYYPQFMYHLRRSPLLDLFNSSPDETVYYRICLLKETVANTMTIICPSLQQYTLNSSQAQYQGAQYQQGDSSIAPVPCLLDSTSLKNDCILLMDDYFHVIIWHGSLINKWVESQYHLLPQYQNLKALLQLPQMHANLLLKSRIPCPKFISCNAGGSQERFILARVNPSSTHKQGAGYDSYGGAGDDGRGTAILTEDVNMKTFMDHLIKLSVSS